MSLSNSDKGRYLSLDELIHSVNYIFDSSRDIVNIFSLTQNRVISSNQTGYEKTGYTLEEIQNTPIEEIYPPEEIPKLIGTLERLAKVGYSEEYLKMYFKNGELRDIWTRSFIIQREPEILAIVNSVDITEQKRVEEKAIHEAKLASIGHATAMLTHELSSYVSSIYSNIELMRRDKENNLSPKSIGYLTSANTKIKMLSDVILNMRKYVHSSHSAKSFFSLDSVVNDALLVLEGYIKTQSVHVKIEFPQNLKPVWTSRVSLQQIILVLLKNAVQAMEDAKEKKITLCTIEKDDQIELTIADSGKGIPLEMQEKIFKSFVSTKPLGTGAGLGLSIAKSLATSNQIDLKFTSQPGQGTTFSLLIPCESSQASMTERQDSPLGGKYVMVVSENSSLLIETGKAVEEVGGRVLSTPSVNEAIRILQHNQVHMVICDNDMYPIKGITFLEEIESYYKGIFILLMNPSDEQQVTFEESATRMLCFKPEQTKKVIEKLIDMIQAIEA